MRRTVLTLSVTMALLVTVLTTMTTSGMFGNWTATATAPNITAQADTISITPLAGGTNTTLNTNITNMVPGDQAYRYVHIQNPTGATNATWSNLAATTRVSTVSGGSAAASDWANNANVRVVIEYCSTGYTYPSTCTGTWTAGGTMAVGTTTMGAATNFTAALPAPGSGIGLRIGYHMCSGSNTPITGCTTTAATVLQGSTATYLTDFVATVRAGVSTK